MAEEAKLKSQMGSDEPVKFTDEELSSLQELQNTYASISTQFGQVKVSRINLERNLENLANGKYIKPAIIVVIKTLVLKDNFDIINLIGSVNVHKDLYQNGLLSKE